MFIVVLSVKIDSLYLVTVSVVSYSCCSAYSYIAFCRIFKWREELPVLTIRNIWPVVTMRSSFENNSIVKIYTNCFTVTDCVKIDCFHFTLWVYYFQIKLFACVSISGEKRNNCPSGIIGSNRCLYRGWSSSFTVNDWNIFVIAYKTEILSASAISFTSYHNCIIDHQHIWLSLWIDDSISLSAICTVLCHFTEIYDPGMHIIFVFGTCSGNYKDRETVSYKYGFRTGYLSIINYVNTFVIYMEKRIAVSIKLLIFRNTYAYIYFRTFYRF